MKIYLAIMLAGGMLWTTAPVFAQRPQNTEIRSGTVKEVLRKGRGRTLVVLCEGAELSFPITPKVNLEVNLTGGDVSLLQRGAYLEGTGIFTNNRFFLESAKVRPLARTANTPDSKMEKPETLEPGQSLNTQHISGQIMLRQTSKEYPEYEEIALKTPEKVPEILFKKEIPVDVVSSDIDDAQADQAVELEVIPGRNDKLILVRATIEGGEYTPPENQKSKK